MKCMCHMRGALDFLPSVDSGDGGIEDHRPARNLRVTANECIRDVSPNIVANNVDTFQSESRNEPVQILRHRGGIVAVR